MSDITAVKAELARNAESIARMLLPHGRREGSEWRAGDTQGTEGTSLGVHLTGAKAGVWADFATGESGDLLDLWQECRGLSLVAALDQARQHLGMQKPEFYSDLPKNFGKPKIPSALTKPKDAVLDYLTNVRKLPKEAIEAYKFGADGDRVVFPFIEKDGETVMVKTRSIHDKDCKPTSKNCKRILMGWHLVTDNDKACCIVEGEFDAPALYSYGFKPTLSVPFGGGGGAKQAWIENDFDKFDQFETIYLVLDDDKAGDEGCEEIASRLGKHRCKRVRLPYKDANECLKRGADVTEAFANAEDMGGEGIRKPTDYLEDVTELFWPEHGVEPGYVFPQSKLGFNVIFRPGEVTVWCGKTGEGKSQFLGDCCVDWVKQGGRTCIASLEMHPKRTLKRMIKQAGNVDRPTAEYIKAVTEWLDDGILLYEAIGKRTVQTILDVFEYARTRYRCDQFVIDSFMRLGIANDDYAAQDHAMFEIVNWAVEKDVHVHLVAHARKMQQGAHQPTADDVKGAGEIASNAANIVVVWRDKVAEKVIADARNQGVDNLSEVIAENPTVFVNVAKQRNGDWTGTTAMWFDLDTYRYSGSPAGEPTREYVRMQ